MSNTMPGGGPYQPPMQNMPPNYNFGLPPIYAATGYRPGPYPGVALAPNGMLVSQKNHIVAGILGICLGVFGVQNFYVGRIGLAVIQLILTLTIFGAPIVGIWSFVEGILYLVSTDSVRWGADGRGVPMV